MENSNLTFLEKIWILFAWCIYIEWIIKDLLIFKSNPLFVDEINDWNISTEILAKRKEKWKDSFNIKLLQKFENSFNISPEEYELINSVRLVRDILWHCRISTQEKQIWYVPKHTEKFREICKLFSIDIEDTFDTIVINESNLNLEDRIKVINDFDTIYFPKRAKSIWLKYENIK